MAHHEENIRTGVACSGTNGLYLGYIHHAAPGGRHDVMRTGPLHFGTHRGFLEDPVLSTNAARDHAFHEYGKVILPEELVAVSILRECARRRHVEPEGNPYVKSRLERVASMAIARSMDDIEPILPLGARERNLSKTGLGHARRITEGSPPLTLVHLPVTQAEWYTYPATAAVKSAVETPAMSQRPYVALHGSHAPYLEKIVLQEDIG